MGCRSRLPNRPAQSGSSGGPRTRRVPSPEGIDVYVAHIFRKAGTSIQDAYGDEAISGQFSLASQHSATGSITAGIFQKREYGLPNTLAIGYRCPWRQFLFDSKLACFEHRLG